MWQASGRNRSCLRLLFWIFRAVLKNKSGLQLLFQAYEANSGVFGENKSW
jgi:hypothetical protein